MQGLKQPCSLPSPLALNQHLNFPHHSLIVLLPHVALELLVVYIHGIALLREVGNDALFGGLADDVFEIDYFSAHGFEFSDVYALFGVELGLSSAEEFDLLGLLEADVGEVLLFALKLLDVLDHLLAVLW